MDAATSNRITNDEDLIDSRDIIARIDQLSVLRQAGPVDLGNDEDNETDQDTLFHELAALEALAKEASDYSGDWEYGATTLIRDSYFVEYAQEFADVIGAVRGDGRWPTYCIDWEWAARDLQQDYASVDFDGVSYWVR